MREGRFPVDDAAPAYSIDEYEECDAPSSPEILQLVAYWNARRGARFAPARAEIEPLAIKQLLPFISMIDVIEDGADFRFRLLGTHIVEALGRDSTGRRFSEVYAGDAAVRQIMIDRMTRITRLKQPVFSRGRCYWRPDRTHKAFEDVNLPLSSDGETVDIILGALVIQLAR
jgi:hypothetical protein